MKRKIELMTADGTCEAYEVYPDGNSKYPPVLLLMDAIGIREALLGLAEKIASAGHFVLVPNLFYRDHAIPLTNYPEKFSRPELSQFFVSSVKGWMSNLTPELYLRDAGSYIEHLESHPFTRKNGIGIVGYCMGGGLGLRTAAAFRDKVKSVVSLHGGNLATASENSPHLLLKDIKAKLYFGHADEDQSMPEEQMERLETALAETKKIYEIKLFKGAHHGFTQGDLPAFHPKACEESLLDTLRIFKETLYE